MNNLKYWLLIVFVGVSTGGFGQRIATLEVSLPRSATHLTIPLHTSLDALTSLPDSVLRLVEVQGKTRTVVPFQIEKANERLIHWNAVGSPSAAATKRTYELVKGASLKMPPSIKTVDKNGALLVQTGNRSLLQYNYKTVYPPAGVDTAYKRSGFIHPLWSPHGQVLTGIQPPDHYHHYGVWNPWTRVLFEGDTVDFWNLRDRKGLVRFANLLSTGISRARSSLSCTPSLRSACKKAPQHILQRIQPAEAE